MGDFFSSMNISASALTAQRLRMDVIAENVANINTTRTETGEPYRRRTVVFEQQEKSFKDILNQSMEDSSGKGVVVTSIAEDESPFTLVYDPTHPDANEEGYVSMPNVNIITEMVDMISASRSYEANITALNAFKNMAMKALEIGR